MQEPIPGTLTGPNGNQIAYVRTNGKAPGIIFLGGYMSDMTGTKALSLEMLCREIGHTCIRFDYSGHGLSEGQFQAGTISTWTHDTLAVLDNIAVGPQILVGSSMGGWIMLLVALARKKQVTGLVGIASASDFTRRLAEDELTDEQITEIYRDGSTTIKSPYAEDPYIFTRTLLEDGAKHLLLDRKIELNCPVRLLHGLLDSSVPWQNSLALANALTSRDVELTLVKTGDHRLSKESDIIRLRKIVADLIASAGR